MTANRLRHLSDIHVLERAFGNLAANHLVPCLDAESEPADTGLPEKIEIFRLNRIDTGIRPRPELDASVDDRRKQGLKVALVEEEHLIRDPYRLNSHRGELFELADDEPRRPETHARRVARGDAVGIVDAVYDVDHAETAPELTTERRIERREWR